MITIEFGKAEKQNLDANSMYIRFLFGYDEKSRELFTEALNRIKTFWNRICHGKPNWEWEVPFSCFEEIKELYKDFDIRYLNDPPKAQKITNDEILQGIDFNGFQPYDYQVAGMKYGIEHRNFLLLDEQGLGKTLQMLKLAEYKKQHLGLKHCLIICCVNSLKWNWIKEIHKFCKDVDGIVLGYTTNKKGNLKDLTVEQTKEQVRSCPKEFFWIINIERMRLNKEEAKNKTSMSDVFNEQIAKGELGMVIIDEVHKCKNIDSAQSKGIMNLDKNISKVGLSGTILVSNPLDLYCPMSFVGLLNLSKWSFENKYVIKDDWNQIVGYQNMDELHSILYKSSLRRTKDLLDLPPKIYKQEWLELSKEEQNIFNQIIGQIESTDLDKITEPTEQVAIITRMRQATVAAELLTSKKVASTKFNRLNDILEEARLNGQKVLVFCPFTEALKLGLEYCKEYNPKLIIGGMGRKLEEVKDQHENTKGFSVLFAQEATLGVGHTLTNTEIVVFLSPPWDRATYDQCIDRCHRIGQNKTVQVIDLLCKDTYDECIYDKLHGKGAMSDAVVDGKDIETLKPFFDKMGVSFYKGKIASNTKSPLL